MLDAKKWTRSLKRSSILSKYNPKEMTCMIYQLTDEADHWWESEQHKMTQEDKDAFNWDQFKERFYEKYILCNYHFQKQIEFWNL